MTTIYSRRLLTGDNSPPPPQITGINPDFAVILVALLCALICVLGLAAVARCAWIRRRFANASASSSTPATANKGLKKKVLKSLPSQKFDTKDEEAAKLSECPICLAEFSAGEEIRVLPHCGHGFHIGCIDMWLASHSSCPSCRQILEVKTRCQKCGGVDSDRHGIQSVPREQTHVNSNSCPISE